MAGLTAREARRTIRGRWLARATAWLGWAGFVGLWYLLTYQVLGERQLPPPHAVADRVWVAASGDGFAGHLSSTFFKVVAGFALAVGLSALVGFASVHRVWWRDLADRVLSVALVVPTVCLAALSLVMFGVSVTGPVLITAAAVMPHMMTSINDGIYGTDRRLVVMSESYGKSRAQIIRSVLVPSAMLSMLRGARPAFAVAWRIELLTEVFAASEGLGFQIRRGYEAYDVEGMIAWTAIAVGAMLVVENLLLRQIDRRMEAMRP